MIPCDSRDNDIGSGKRYILNYIMFSNYIVMQCIYQLYMDSSNKITVMSCLVLDSTYCSWWGYMTISVDFLTSFYSEYCKSPI